MQFEALNPVGNRTVPDYLGLSPRLDSLNGKTIGLFDNAKRGNPDVMRRIEELLKERYPDVKTSWFRKGTYKQPMWEEEKAWAKTLDGVIGMCGN